MEREAVMLWLGGAIAVVALAVLGAVMVRGRSGPLAPAPTSTPETAPATAPASVVVDPFAVSEVNPPLTAPLVVIEPTLGVTVRHHSPDGVAVVAFFVDACRDIEGRAVVDGRVVNVGKQALDFELDVSVVRALTGEAVLTTSIATGPVAPGAAATWTAAAPLTRSLRLRCDVDAARIAPAAIGTP